MDSLPLSEAKRKILRALGTRQGRRKSGLFTAEGQRCAAEALAALPGQCDFALIDAEADPARLPPFPPGLPVYRDSAAAFKELALTENPQGVLVVLRRPDFVSPEFSGSFTLVLDGLQDPGNIGTILRTAWACGLRDAIVTEGTVDPYNPKAVRAGMGAQFRLRISKIDSLKDLAALPNCAGRTAWLTTPRDGVSCFAPEFDLRGGLLVFGEEGGGVSDFSVGKRVSIPMPGAAESLNVAQAATVFLFEGVRRGWL
ncbi:MAG: hypothetical protein RL095_1008 [Verrucomicrobiota bacterium]|jgi:TrmH family RNA methyltransferase